MLLDATLLYRMFGSRIFPAEGAWPPGVAAAGAIQAGDEGGRKAVVLGGGLALGIGGSLLGIPMAGFGVAFIGNAWALSMFAGGLLLRGSLPAMVHRLGTWSHGAAGWASANLGNGHLGDTHIPQGVMLGAGLMALLQVCWTILGHARNRGRGQRTAEGTAAVSEVKVGEVKVGATLGLGAALYVAIAVMIALLGGLYNEMSTGMLIGFVLFAAFAALLHELIIGLAAMHSGWFPAFAVAVVTLAVGILIGFPAPALALMVGFSASTGPAFADMGCDLRAGFLLRGQGSDPAFEQDGRRQQYFAAMYALGVAAIVVFASYRVYFAHNTLPPVDHVFVAAIKAGSSPGVAHDLMIWAIPGLLLQLVGGSRRQLGIMAATGLLLSSVAAGWAVLAGLLCRAVWMRWRGEAGRGDMQVFAAGSIAGDALTSFGSSIVKLI